MSEKMPPYDTQETLIYALDPVSTEEMAQAFFAQVDSEAIAKIHPSEAGKNADIIVDEINRGIPQLEDAISSQMNEDIQTGLVSKETVEEAKYSALATATTLSSRSTTIGNFKQKVTLSLMAGVALFTSACGGNAVSPEQAALEEFTNPTTTSLVEEEPSAIANSNEIYATSAVKSPQLAPEITPPAAVEEEAGEELSTISFAEEPSSQETASIAETSVDEPEFDEALKTYEAQVYAEALRPNEKPYVEQEYVGQCGLAVAAMLLAEFNSNAYSSPEFALNLVETSYSYLVDGETSQVRLGDLYNVLTASGFSEATTGYNYHLYDNLNYHFSQEGAGPLVVLIDNDYPNAEGSPVPNHYVIVDGVAEIDGSRYVRVRDPYRNANVVEPAVGMKTIPVGAIPDGVGYMLPESTYFNAAKGGYNPGQGIDVFPNGIPAGGNK
ncbi:MAG: hypothetical protein ACOZAO_05810 [Patescibacteria group bacterium]